MYAVIKSGGKQYRVREGDKLRVEKLEAAPGDDVDLSSVLLIGEGDDITVGAPYVEGCKVSARVVGHGRAKKIRIIKFRRRQKYMRTQGHRQSFTELEITGVARA